MTGVHHIAGQTYHGRRGATKNAFRYSVDYVLLDAEAQVNGPALFGRNAAGLMALWDRDHGGRPIMARAQPGCGMFCRARPAGAGDDRAIGAATASGPCVQPVSFWLCRDAEGALRIVIAEVTNTFGDRHSYLCHHDDLRPITRDGTMQAQKIMHVSPFQPVEGGYVFRFDITAQSIGIWIDYSRGNGGLIATLHGARRPLTSRGILWPRCAGPLARAGCWR